MGFSPGDAVLVKRKMPWHGNLYVKIGERSVAMRYDEAEQVQVVLN